MASYRSFNNTPTNSKISKNHKSKYNKEFNTELGMTIYYTPNTIPKILFDGIHKSGEPQLMTKSSKECNYLKDFILKILDNHLWKYKDALCEFQSYIIDVFNENEESAWVGDMAFYKNIQTQYKLLNIKYDIQSKLGENTDGGVKRGDNRVKSIEKYVLYRQPRNNRIEPSCYLDIGCFDGGITHSIAKYFKLHKLQTHGVDIKSYGGDSGYSNITFSQYDGKILPYSDNSFDLITCLMVLHHVPEDNLKILMSEINRVMRPGGVVILREHNVSNNTERMSLDVMHNFYDCVWDGSHYISNDEIQTNHWKTNYKSNDEWTEIFITNGFDVYTPAIVFNNFKLNPFMTYMCSYRKPHIHQLHDIIMYREMSDKLPREIYKSTSKKIKNVLHWGQRKLLLTEIEFFTMFLSTNPSIKTKIYAIYAGSSPGTHILYLAKLFPNIHFELYDPRNFSDKLLKNTNMIKTHIQYFTDETAKEWVSTNHPDKTILLISDIRTGEPETQTSEQVEERVKIDHSWQQNWYHIIKPEMAMFKFRLPWDDEKTEYLNGDIYIQPYPPSTSTETRLIVGKNAYTKIYDNRKYEEQMFYFNNNVRPMNFQNILYNIHPTRKNGLSNNYDGAAEVYILGKYLKLHNQNFKKDSDLTKQITDMVGEISRELSHSRTLFSKQPVKNHKKKLLINLQKLGYIPNNIELSQHTFNTYVIPRYEYFESNGLL
jgi:SAM-dependent methyltransferase